MTTPSQPAAASRIDVVLEPSFWVQHRVTLLGVALGVGALVLGIKYVRDRADSGDARGWAALANPEYPMQPRQEGIPIDATRGTSAEPWALFQSARNQFAEYHKSMDIKDLDVAIAFLGELESKFSTHALVRDGRLAALKQDLVAERAWTASHPTSSSNAQPSDTNVVTLVVDQGEIEIGVYPDAAPSSVKAFLDMVRTPEKASFVEGSSGYALTLSADGPATTAEEPKSDSKAEMAVPKPWGKDRNALTHTKGCVSFLRSNPFADDEKQTVNVHIALRDDPSRDGSQVVFGVVTKGLDLLEKIAESEKSESDPSRFKTPLKVKSIREAAGLSTIK